MTMLLKDWLYWWLDTLRVIFEFKSEKRLPNDNSVTVQANGFTLSSAGNVYKFDNAADLAAHLSSQQEHGAHGRKSFKIRFENDRAIVRKLTAVSLPDSRHKSAAILDLEASTPFRLTDVHVLPAKSSSGAPGAHYAIVKRVLLAPIVEALTEARAHIDTVEIQDSEQSFVMTRSAKNALFAKKRDIVNRSQIAALAACGFLTLSTFAHYTYQYSAAAARLEQSIEPLNESAKAVRLELDKRAARIAELQTLRETIEKRKPTITIWEELARVLPDSSFLTDMTISQDKLSVAGYSQSASGIIVALEGSDIFDEVAFTAPVVKVPGRTDDRFAIDLKIGEK